MGGFKKQESKEINYDYVYVAILKYFEILNIETPGDFKIETKGNSQSKFVTSNKPFLLNLQQAQNHFYFLKNKKILEPSTISLLKSNFQPKEYAFECSNTEIMKWVEEDINTGKAFDKKLQDQQTDHSIKASKQEENATTAYPDDPQHAPALQLFKQFFVQAYSLKESPSITLVENPNQEVPHNIHVKFAFESGLKAEKFVDGLFNDGIFNETYFEKEQIKLPKEIIFDSAAPQKQKFSLTLSPSCFALLQKSESFQKTELLKQEHKTLFTPLLYANLETLGLMDENVQTFFRTSGQEAKIEFYKNLASSLTGTYSPTITRKPFLETQNVSQYTEALRVENNTPLPSLSYQMSPNERFLDLFQDELELFLNSYLLLSTTLFQQSDNTADKVINIGQTILEGVLGWLPFSQIAIKGISFVGKQINDHFKSEASKNIKKAIGTRGEKVISFVSAIATQLQETYLHHCRIESLDEAGYLATKLSHFVIKALCTPELATQLEAIQTNNIALAGKQKAELFMQQPDFNQHIDTLFKNIHAALSKDAAASLTEKKKTQQRDSDQPKQQYSFSYDRLTQKNNASYTYRRPQTNKAEFKLYFSWEQRLQFFEKNQYLINELRGTKGIHMDSLTQTIDPTPLKYKIRGIYRIKFTAEAGSEGATLLGTLFQHLNEQQREAKTNGRSL